MLVHRDQGYLVIVKVTLVKWVIPVIRTTYAQYIVLMWSSRPRSSHGQGHIEVKFFPEAGDRSSTETFL